MARTKMSAFYGLLALTVAVVGSSAPQSAETASLLAAARTDGYERYLPSQMGHLGEQGKNKVVNMHGCETRLRMTPMGEGRARLHLLSPFFGMKAVDVRNYMLEHFGTSKAYVDCNATLDPRWTAVTRVEYIDMVDSFAHHITLHGPGWTVTPPPGRKIGDTLEKIF